MNPRDDVRLGRIGRPPDTPVEDPSRRGGPGVHVAGPSSGRVVTVHHARDAQGAGRPRPGRSGRVRPCLHRFSEDIGDEEEVSRFLKSPHLVLPHRDPEKKSRSQVRRGAAGPACGRRNCEVISQLHRGFRSGARRIRDVARGGAGGRSGPRRVGDLRRGGCRYGSGRCRGRGPGRGRCLPGRGCGRNRAG